MLDGGLRIPLQDLAAGNLASVICTAEALPMDANQGMEADASSQLIEQQELAAVERFRGVVGEDPEPGKSRKEIYRAYRSQDNTSKEVLVKAYARMRVVITACMQEHANAKSITPARTKFRVCLQREAEES